MHPETARLDEHANDPAARKFFAEGAAGAGRALLDYSEWFLDLTLVPVFLWLRKRESSSDETR